MRNLILHVDRQSEELKNWLRNYWAYEDTHVKYNHIEKQRQAVLRRINKFRKLLDEIEQSVTKEKS